MCSISGGTKWDRMAADIWEQAKDRGRDLAGMHMLDYGQWIGNRRATPTTEVIHPIEDQPVGEDPWIVFNGIIANDKELGLREGEADTSVLPRVLDFSSLAAFRDSLEQKIIGSYALAVLFADGTIWLACNYKPIWIHEQGEEVYFSSMRHHLPLEGYKAYRFPPYSVGVLGPAEKVRGRWLPIRRKQPDRALVLCSAGLDSAVTAAYARSQHEHTELLYFDYGSIQGPREMERLESMAKYLGCPHRVIPLPLARWFAGASAMFGDEQSISGGVEGAEYAHEWVPARNLIMMANAVGFAEAHDFGHIYMGIILEGGGAYPDQEEQFALDFNECLWGAVGAGKKVQIHTPLGNLTKREIVQWGQELVAPFHLTWSCYRAGERHCGQCAPCFVRRTAFERNGLQDPVFVE